MGPCISSVSFQLISTTLSSLCWCRHLCLSEDNMERNIPRLLLIHLIFFVLSTPLSAVTTGLSILKVVPISNSNTWAVAQNYCRWYHSDLITIRNQQEADKYAPYEGWIGLYLNTSSSGWKWSRGEERATFFNWDSNEPDDDQHHHCVLKDKSSPKWKNERCSDNHPFLCDEGLILVQEKKTWEEALVHCRQLEAAGCGNQWSSTF
ncbi:C-type mannose receptor 2-like [Sander lucioperca]|uniref:C-type mannose receptor 2-like n=1 Tax=Sander lucioperca TaxID=283035 RepID=UPI00125E367E|nr:C-type mannose receptor 2-like [Sander lucioperca]